MEWKLAEAKNRFSELVNLALSEGPQRVVRRGDAVVVLSESQFDKLTGKRAGFKEFLLGRGSEESGMEDPDFDILDLERDRSLMRDGVL